MGFIIWAIIIIWIAVVVVKKNQQTGNSRQSGRPGSAGQNGAGNPQGIYNAAAKKRPSAVPNQPSKTTGKDAAFDPWQGFNQSGNAMKQQATKERLQRKYGKMSQPGGDILQRAKASVAEDFNKDELKTFAGKASRAKAPGNAGAAKPMGNGTDGAASMVQDAKRRQQEMERRIAEKLASAEAEQSDIMKTVEDLMVKGPDTSIAFQRDFVSEGLELLNRVQG